MERREYDVMERLQDHHWWFAAKRTVVSGLLSRHCPPRRKGDRVLEIGCGTGAMIPVLRDRGDVWGVDTFTPALEHVEDARRIAGDALRLPFADGSFALVGLFDLLYHRRVPDVGASLSEAFRVCASGGHVVITDSAFASLRGPHDDATHGMRRFRAGQLDALLRDAGFATVVATYFHTTMFPVAAVVRLAQRILPRRGIEEAAPRSDLSPAPSIVNAAAGFVYRMEAPLAARGMLPFGLSVLALARKAGTPTPGASATGTPTSSNSA